MAEGALGVVRATSGVVVGLDDGRTLAPAIEVSRGDHPRPTRRSLASGRALLEAARRLGPSDVAVCLVSGGASAMVEVPVEGVGLADLVTATDVLLASGSPIEEINAVRRALSRLKGGRLADACGAARVITVTLSDVPGEPPSVVGSGPTLPPPIDAPDARAVVASRGLEPALPSAVLEALRRAPAPLSRNFGEDELLVAADNRVAQDAVLVAARERGLVAERLDGFVSGEARDAGPAFVARAAALDVDAVVWGGETTVVVRGQGRGGRNHELVLGALDVVGDHLLLSVGTDGVDGTSGAAGAFLDPPAVAAARAYGLDASRFLADNDAAAFFGRTGTRLVTGPTGTNVADLLLWLR
jgi:hydroxypyruvate reductase